MFTLETVPPALLIEAVSEAKPDPGWDRTPGC